MAEKGSLVSASEKTIALRNQFLQLSQNPYRHMTGEGGHVFDPSFYRHQALRSNHWEYFKPTYKSAKPAIFGFIVPFCIMYYLVNRERSTKEEAYRTGKVSYRDRNFKFS